MMSLQRYVVSLTAIISYAFAQLNSLLEFYTGTRELARHTGIPVWTARFRELYVINQINIRCPIEVLHAQQCNAEWELCQSKFFWPMTQQSCGNRFVFFFAANPKSSLWAKLL